MVYSKNKFVNTNQSIELVLPTFQDKVKNIFDALDVAEDTRKEYKKRIEVFFQFIKNKPFNENSFLSYKQYLKEKSDLTVSTKNKYLISTKIFLKELHRKGILPYDITQNIKTFSQTKKHKKEGLNEEEIRQVVDKIKNLQPTPKNSRLKAIFSLLIFQGLRQCEICRLDIKDLDLIHKTTFVQGKGQDDKELIDLHPETVKVLDEYLKSNNIKDGPLFISTSNHCRDQRLSTKTIRTLVKDILKDLEIVKSTHGFRHFFTSKLIKTYKGDLLEVGRYTRHKSLEILQIYNDNIKRQADLPRFYQTFSDINLDKVT